MDGESAETKDYRSEVRGNEKREIRCTPSCVSKAMLSAERVRLKLELNGGDSGVLVVVGGTVFPKHMWIV